MLVLRKESVAQDRFKAQGLEVRSNVENVEVTEVQELVRCFLRALRPKSEPHFRRILLVSGEHYKECSKAYIVPPKRKTRSATSTVH